jgi:N-acetylglutamate synthase-like GNAT family acetyltransferase
MAAIRTLTFTEFPHGSAGYLELARLRDLHLRQPIGLRLRPEDRIGEEHHRHFALEEEGGEIVGGLISVPLGNRTTQLRQMWIHPRLRTGGHGTYLLTVVEENLTSSGIRKFVLHARQNAVGFYRKNGYTSVGEPFTEVGRPHQAMEKILRD